MKCSRCGADIKDGSVYCDVCGEEIRIVPDYSALDEVLVAHVRDEIESERRSQKTTKKKRNDKKKKMLIILGILFFSLLIGFMVYQGSYDGQVQKGYNALEKEKFNTAMKRFQTAIEMDSKKPDAYIGLSKVYIRQNDLHSAENVFLTQISKQESNVDIYLGAAEFYVETEQMEKIPLMLDACHNDDVLEAMKEYMVPVPEFSLKEDTYEEEQELELLSDEHQIYYTLDESQPTEKSGTRYGTEIHLGEGEWIVKAIAVNENGIPSMVTEKKFVVELPAADPPIVYPSTGLYESEMEISIQVPEGFTAYYIFGDTKLNAKNGKKYTGPIKMPEGNQIFSAILVDNSTGKTSGTTVRNYDLKLTTELSTSDEE